jgi:hypothetical protein
MPPHVVALAAVPLHRPTLLIVRAEISSLVMEGSHGAPYATPSPYLLPSELRLPRDHREVPTSPHV